jgi:hypothetical protein
MQIPRRGVKILRRTMQAMPRISGAVLVSPVQRN